MPHDTVRLGSPEEWLLRAKSNLAMASIPKSNEIFWEDLCFETQQAAEKALKAVLIWKKIPFRFVHDLAEQLTLLENNGVFLPDAIRAAAALTDYSVEARYPGTFEAVAESEYNDALQTAQLVVAWAESLIAEKR